MLTKPKGIRPGCHPPGEHHVSSSKQCPSIVQPVSNNFCSWLPSYSIHCRIPSQLCRFEQPVRRICCVDRLCRIVQTWHADEGMAASCIQSGICFSLSEFINGVFTELSDYVEIFRTGQMIAGAVLMASLYRDRQALRAGLSGYIIAGISFSVFLFLTYTVHGT